MERLGALRSGRIAGLLLAHLGPGVRLAGRHVRPSALGGGRYVRRDRLVAGEQAVRHDLSAQLLHLIR